MVNYNADSIPTEDDCEDLTHHSFLQFTSDVATACVEAKFNESQEVGFSIVMFTSNTVLNLDLNSPHYMTINGNDQQYFSFLCNPNEESIFITKHILSSGLNSGSNINNDLQLYVGSNYFKDSSKYELDFSNHHSSTIVLDYNSLVKLCMDDQERILEEIESCEIFVLVKS